MTQFEINQIKSRLRRLELSDDFVDQYVNKLQTNCESYAMACKTIDRWKKKIVVRLFRRFWPVDSLLLYSVDF